MLVCERFNVVNHTAYNDELTSFAGLSEVIPCEDGKVVRRFRPLDLFGSSLDLLHLHGELTGLDLVVGESLELRSETELVASEDEPLGGVVLVPLDGVAEVLGELVVEVVVTFSYGNESGNPVVLGRVLVVEGSVSEPVGERVDAEGRVVDEEETSGTGEEESSAVISPSESGDEGREDESHSDDEVDVPTVLPLDNLVLREIGNVGDSGLATRFDEHPSDVRPPESFVRRVRVEIRIRVAVVSAVTPTPPLDRSFYGSRSSESEEILKRKTRGIRSVRKKAVIPSGNSKSGVKVVKNRPQRRLPLDFGREGTVEGEERYDGES